MEGFQHFLALWTVEHRLSSVAYPQSNGHAEVAVEASKSIDSLNNDKVAHPILQYRNTPLPDIGLIPAQILFHRQLRDSIPSHPTHYRHQQWMVSAEEREKMLSKCNHILVKKHSRVIPYQLNKYFKLS